jgi:hypothetical protein
LAHWLRRDRVCLRNRKHGTLKSRALERARHGSHAAGARARLLAAQRRHAP